MPCDPSALWASILWLFPACTVPAGRCPVLPSSRTSSHGCTWHAGTCTVTMSGATAQSVNLTANVSAPCAGLWGPMCHSGQAVNQPSMWTQQRLRMPSYLAVTSARRSQPATGLKFLYHMVPMLSMLHAHSVPHSSVSHRDVLSSSSRALQTECAAHKDWLDSNGVGIKNSKRKEKRKRSKELLHTTSHEAMFIYYFQWNLYSPSLSISEVTLEISEDCWP